MADVKHTPAPWRVTDAGEWQVTNEDAYYVSWCAIEDAEGTRIALPFSETPGCEALDANALLIAAAPTLLEAAKSARDVLLATHPVDRTRDEQKALDDLTAAIALAKGEKVDG